MCTCDRPSPANNEAECAYMKVLLEKIAMSETHSISTMAAIHLSTEVSQQTSTQSSSKKITKQRAEELLEEWVASGYLLMLAENDLITLGPKAIAEFRDTFRTKFPDFIQNCHLCSDIVLKVKQTNNKCWPSKFTTEFDDFDGEFKFHFFVFLTAGGLSKRQL